MTGLTNERIGLNLEQMREYADMTMEELANAMRERGHKWTKVTVFNIEHGERQLKLLEAFDVVAALGLDSDGVAGLTRFAYSSNEESEVKNSVDSVLASRNQITSGAHSLKENISYLFMLRDFGRRGAGIIEDMSEKTQEAYAEACKKFHVEEVIEASQPGLILKEVNQIFSEED